MLTGTAHYVPCVRVAVVDNRYITLTHTWRSGHADGGRCGRCSGCHVFARDLVAHHSLHLKTDEKQNVLLTCNDVY